MNDRTRENELSVRVHCMKERWWNQSSHMRSVLKMGCYILWVGRDKVDLFCVFFPLQKTVSIVTLLVSTLNLKRWYLIIILGQILDRLFFRWLRKYCICFQPIIWHIGQGLDDAMNRWSCYKLTIVLDQENVASNSVSVCFWKRILWMSP